MPGDYDFRITVTDRKGASAIGEFRIHVQDPLQSALPEGCLEDLRIAIPFRQPFGLTGGIPPYNLEVTGELPPGLLLEADQLAGLPGRTGEYRFKIQIRDSDPISPQTLVREVCLNIGVPLHIYPASDQIYGQVGQPFDVAFASRTGQPPFQIGLQGQVPGLDFDAGRLRGTPDTPGDYDLQVSFEDASSPPNRAERTYQLHIYPGGLAPLPPRLPQEIPSGQDFAQDLRALGGTPPYCWSLLGPPPPGLSLDPGGLLHGRPDAPGDYDLPIEVRDGRGQTAKISLSLHIGPSAFSALTPDDLPHGLVDTPYEIPFQASGGSPPYECALAEGVLPPGMELSDCLLRGQPSESGDFGLGVEIQDARGARIRVDRPLHVATSPPLAAGTPPVLVMDTDIRLDTACGGPIRGQDDESAEAVAHDPFGDLFVAGYGSNGRDFDLVLVRLAADGRPLWKRHYDAGGQDYGYGLAMDPIAQGIYVAGYRQRGLRYEPLVVKFAPNGDVLWQQGLPDTGIAAALYAALATRDGVLLAGEGFNGRDFDALFARLSTAGNLLWQRRYGGHGDDTAYAFARADLEDGPHLWLGGVTRNDALTPWVLELDPATGKVRNQRILGKGSDVVALGFCSNQLFAGGTTADGDWRLWGLDDQLATRWEQTFDNPGEDVLRGLACDHEGNLYALGRHFNGHDSDLFVKVLSPNGEPLDSFAFDEGLDERGRQAVIGPDGHLTLVGDETSGSNTRFLIVPMDNGKAY